jgi:hypothetical protein
MPCVGFEATIPAPERAKAVYVLDRSATVAGPFHILPRRNSQLSHFKVYNEARKMSYIRKLTYEDFYNNFKSFILIMRI